MRRRTRPAGAAGECEGKTPAFRSSQSVSVKDGQIPRCPSPLRASPRRLGLLPRATGGGGGVGAVCVCAWWGGGAGKERASRAAPPSPAGPACARAWAGGRGQEAASAPGSAAAAERVAGAAEPAPRAAAAGAGGRDKGDGECSAGPGRAPAPHSSPPRPRGRGPEAPKPRRRGLRGERGPALPAARCGLWAEPAAPFSGLGEVLTRTLPLVFLPFPLRNGYTLSSKFTTGGRLRKPTAA